MPLTLTEIPLGTSKSDKEKLLFNGLDWPKIKEFYTECGKLYKYLRNEIRYVFHYSEEDEVFGLSPVGFSDAFHYLNVHKLRSASKWDLSLINIFKRWRYNNYDPAEIDLSEVRNPAYGILLYVFKEHRENGIGTKIVKEEKSELERMGHDALITQSLPELEGFYQSLGFKVMLENSKGKTIMINKL